MGAPDFLNKPSKKAVNWRDFIHTDPSILLGKPIVRNTRLSVDFILRLFGNGWTIEEVLLSYPRLTPSALQAVFAYTGECMSEESLYALPQGKE